MEQQSTAYDLRRFLADLLRKLHLLLLASLLGAVLLGGLRGGLDLLGDLKRQPVPVNQEMLASLQRDITFNDQLMAEYRHYDENSLYQNLDAARISRLSLTAYVRFNPDESVDESELEAPAVRTRNDAIILNAYRQIGLTDTALVALDELYGRHIEKRYYDELIVIDVLSDANLVRVTALSDQPQLSQQMAETVLYTLYAELTAQVLPHSLALVRTGSSTVVDTALRTHQHEMRERITRLESDQQTLKRQFRNLSNPTVSRRFSVQNTLKFAAFGALIALTLVLLLLLLVDVVSLKLDDERTLNRRFNWPILARLPVAGRRPGRLERWIGRRLLGTLEPLDETQQLTLLHARVSRLLPTVRPALVLVTSSLLNIEQLTELARQLAATWTDSSDLAVVRQADDDLTQFAPQIRCCFVPAESVNHAATAAMLADRLDGCLIVEQQGRSLLPQIERQWLQLQDLKIPLLGCICRCPAL